MDLQKSDLIDKFKYAVYDKILDDFDIESKEVDNVKEMLQKAMRATYESTPLEPICYWYRLTARLICEKNGVTGYRPETTAKNINDFEYTGQMLFKNLLYDTPMSIDEYSAVFKGTHKVILNKVAISSLLKLNRMFFTKDLDINIAFRPGDSYRLTLLKRRFELRCDTYYPQYDGFLIKELETVRYFATNVNVTFPDLLNNYLVVLKNLGYTVKLKEYNDNYKTNSN